MLSDWTVELHNETGGPLSNARIRLASEALDKYNADRDRP